MKMNFQLMKSIQVCALVTINIWRKEEVMKVTIHECIRLLEYDHKNEMI